MSAHISVEFRVLQLEIFGEWFQLFPDITNRNMMNGISTYFLHFQLNSLSPWLAASLSFESSNSVPNHATPPYWYSEVDGDVTHDVKPNAFF